MGLQIPDTCWQTELPCSCEQGRQAKAVVVNSLRVSLPSASHTLTPLVSAFLSLLAALLVPDLFRRNQRVAAGATKNICGRRGAGMGTRSRAPTGGPRRLAAFGRIAACLAVLAAALNVFAEAESVAAYAQTIAVTFVGLPTIDTCWQTELPCSCEQGRQAKAVVVNSLRVSLPSASHTLTPLCLTETTRNLAAR